MFHLRSWLDNSALRTVQAVRLLCVNVKSRRPGTVALGMLWASKDQKSGTDGAS